LQGKEVMATLHEKKDGSKDDKENLNLTVEFGCHKAIFVIIRTHNPKIKCLQIITYQTSTTKLFTPTSKMEK